MTDTQMWRSKGNCGSQSCFTPKMKLKEATRVRIAIKREAPWDVSIKSEAATSPQQEDTPMKHVKDESKEKVVHNIKQKDIKDDTLNKLKLKQGEDTELADNIKEEDTLKASIQQALRPPHAAGRLHIKPSWAASAESASCAASIGFI
ncbi:hypothetical protein MBANPS3_001314 [Mucor bainieri]